MRLGVVGWGLRKSVAKLAHRPEAGTSLVALADPDEAVWNDFKEFTGGDTYHELSDLLGLNLDAVFVLSPDYLHETHAVALLEAGIPIFLEKPLAITLESCDRILETAERTGTKLYAGHNMRFFPVMRQMKAWIDAGLIGEVKTAWCRHFVSYGGEAYFKDWHADRRNTTGLLLQKGAHDIDILHWLCGSYTRKVTAMGQLMVYGDLERLGAGETQRATFDKVWPPKAIPKLASTLDIEDVNLMLMELENGVLASYQQCHFSPDAWRNYTIIGTEGRIENFGDTPGASVVRLWNQARYGYAEKGDLEAEIPPLEGTHGGADPGIVADFLNYVRDGASPLTSPLDARMSVAAGIAATDSLRSGSVPVEVPTYRNSAKWTATI